MGDGTEVVLRGGYTNAGLVVRVGDTVRRPWRPTTAGTDAAVGRALVAGAAADLWPDACGLTLRGPGRRYDAGATW